jgi:methylthioribulose-1-phosphate dehydratase
MDRRGWVPATAGNLSVRLDAGRIAITRSGGHKGFLDAGSVMQVDLDGRPLTDARPSAETLLHCQIYRLHSHVGAVVHGHQDIARLAATVETTIAAGSPLGYLIRGHGVYIWGPDMDAALARLEGLEFLLACELETRKLQR